MVDFFRRLFAPGPGSDDSDDPGTAPSEEYTQTLLTSLEATDAYERVIAAVKLGQAREVRAVPGLIRAARTTMVQDFIDRMQHSEQATEYGTMALFNEVTRAEGDLKQAAAEALGLIAEAHPAQRETIIPVLEALSGDRSYYASVAARHALERLTESGDSGQ